MAIIDDLMELYSNGWEASFDYNSQQCWVFPKSVNDIIVVIGEKEYQATSFDELISYLLNSSKYALFRALFEDFLGTFKKN